MREGYIPGPPQAIRPSCRSWSDFKISALEKEGIALQERSQELRKDIEDYLARVEASLDRR